MRDYTLFSWGSGATPQILHNFQASDRDSALIYAKNTSERIANAHYYRFAMARRDSATLAQWEIEIKPMILNMRHTV